MRSLFQRVSPLVLAAVLVAPVALVGCSAHVRVYDPYYNDYHVWDHHEVVYYQQWEVNTHRPHVEFSQRNQADQKEYWTWRHSQH
jgi:hypothetical protein